jgi:hypothetical protein
VETVEAIRVTREEPEVTVLVTGQVVTVVNVLRSESSASRLTIELVYHSRKRTKTYTSVTTTPDGADKGSTAELEEVGNTDGLAPGGVPLGGVADGRAELVSVTGQTVVDIAIVEVTTLVAPAGQDVTLGLQLVTVTTVVVKTVEVVITGVDDDVSVGPELLSSAADEETAELEGVRVSLLGGALDTELLELRLGGGLGVTSGGLQSNSIRWIPKSHSSMSL